MELVKILLLIFGIVLVSSSWISAFLKKSNSTVSAKAFSIPTVPDLSFRFYKAEDKARCIEIYEAIEAQSQIPNGMVDEFVDYLNSEDEEQKIFIIQSGKEIIATCGVKNLETSIFLLYGLVKPEYQRKGLGAVMLALRSEELSGEQNMIGLNPTEHSEPYYKRYGFFSFYCLGDEVYPEGDKELLDLEKEDLKTVMFLSVDKVGALFMRRFLEKTFTKQLI